MLQTTRELQVEKLTEIYVKPLLYEFPTQNWQGALQKKRTRDSD